MSEQPVSNQYETAMYLGMDRDELREVIASLQQRIAELERYAHHLSSCDYLQNELSCTCGLDDLLATEMRASATPAAGIDYKHEYEKLFAQLDAPPQPPPASQWQPVETAPKHTELLVYREDAGVMLGIYTSPDAFTPESCWDKTAEELGDAFEAEDWFLFCWDGAERADDDLAPTHWIPLPSPPETKPAATESNPGGTGLEQSPSDCGDGRGDSGLTPGGVGGGRAIGNPILHETNEHMSPAPLQPDAQARLAVPIGARCSGEMGNDFTPIDAGEAPSHAESEPGSEVTK